jgi:hypothetical protein
MRRSAAPPSRARRYGRVRRGEHRIISVAHHEQPSYSRRVLRMLTRLFR